MSVALVAACFVDRPSQSFECKTNADCASYTDGRLCLGGYCVVSGCPRDCTECNEVARTCTAECTSADSCNNVTCPSGWECTIHCTGGNACADITCENDAKCSITCSGTDACENVSCGSACACDLDCAAGACNTPVCPTSGNGTNQVPCTTDGTDGANCDSGHAAGCATC